MDRQIEDYIFEDLDLRDRIVLDAATGVGHATRRWAHHMASAGRGGKLISVDIDQPTDLIERIEADLAGLDLCLQVVEADIFNLHMIDDGTVDIVSCDDTVVFLNPRPLKLLSAFEEFHRVLGSGGELIIVSEIPVERANTTMGQWRRWNLAKAIWALAGETWSTEPLPEEMTLGLRLAGFGGFRKRIFPPSTTRNYEGVLKEWRQQMIDRVNAVPWLGLKRPMLDTIETVCDEIHERGYLTIPGQYVLKCTKL